MTRSGEESTRTTEAKERPRWMVGGATILTFVALLYLIELIDQLTGHSLDQHGIRPLEAPGLWGIIWAPVLHASWTHLLANTVPALVLGYLVTLAGMSRFVWATVIVWVVGGFGTWIIGNWGGCHMESDHIGASGLIFGWLTFLLVFGIFVRRFWDIVTGLVVLFAYGGLLLNAVPVLDQCGQVSWQGHLCGAVAGVLAAYVLSGPERRDRASRKASRKASKKGYARRTAG
ncbi:rhomboid family intramembrane serine protease [Mycobacterium sp.]|uniref:rhomboid family intramembrane serine protease n=1 Tax=Mycobacterium sp. TaxID=1785 RepID=UPI003A83D010